MARTKVTTLFNKNHISIVKIENGLVSFPTRAIYTKSQPKIENWVRHSVTHGGSSNSSPESVKRKNREEKPVSERVKSPLGFYYTRTVYPQTLTQRTKTETRTKHEWTFYNHGIMFILTYYTEYCGTRVNTEIHPWDLIDKKAMEDNFINALLEEVVKIIDGTKIKNDVELKQPTRSKFIGEEKHYAGTLGEVKRLIFTDLFGYPEGPKYQTNDEKILSHGFDLKTSFRNM